MRATLAESPRPLLLDLFCGAGGAAMGYAFSGFNVVGVDIKPQPHYPFEFHQADALKPPVDLGAFDAIHASPPCQHFSTATAWGRDDRDRHPDLIEPSRALLQGSGLPYVIENVRQAPLRPSLMLCGSQFGLGVRRHRYFETNVPMPLLREPCQHRRSDMSFIHKHERAYADAMGCDWMTSVEARQAIPPAYTAFIGAQLLEHLSSPSGTLAEMTK